MSWTETWCARPPSRWGWWITRCARLMRRGARWCLRGGRGGGLPAEPYVTFEALELAGLAFPACSQAHHVHGGDGIAMEMILAGALRVDELEDRVGLAGDVAVQTEFAAAF